MSSSCLLLVLSLFGEVRGQGSRWLVIQVQGLELEDEAMARRLSGLGRLAPDVALTAFQGHRA